MDLDSQLCFYEPPSNADFPQIGYPTYRDVHFNIISTYRFDEGFPDQAAADAFRQETTELFTAAGWQIHKARDSWSSDKAILGKSELFLHPMDITGIISVNLIPEVEKLIHQAKSFRLNITRESTEYIEMDDDTYRRYLDSRREEIRTAILTCCQTKRRVFGKIVVQQKGAKSAANKSSIRSLPVPR